jgi:flagellar motor component MotA
LHPQHKKKYKHKRDQSKFDLIELCFIHKFLDNIASGKTIQDIEKMAQARIEEITHFYLD